MPSLTEEKLQEYKKRLKRKERVERVLAHLNKYDAPLELLRSTGVYKYISQLRDDREHGDVARRLLDKWKREGEGKKKVDKKQASTPQQKSTSSSSGMSEFERVLSGLAAQDYGSKAGRKRKSEETSGSSSSLPKLPILDWNSEDLKVDDLYRPLPQKRETVSSTKAAPPPSEAVDPTQFRARGGPMKIFAGRRRFVPGQTVPRLFDICLSFVGAHVALLENTGDIPYSILKPALQKATPTQLKYIENRNPYLAEESDELWESLCSSEFPDAEPEEGEWWRECYERSARTKAKRLQRLSQKIAARNAQESSSSRKTLLSEAVAPRHVRRAQIANGTGHVNRALPSALEVSVARRRLGEQGPSSSFASLPAAIRNTNSRAASLPSSSKAKPQGKIAPLWAKTMKMAKSRNH